MSETYSIKDKRGKELAIVVVGRPSFEENSTEFLTKPHYQIQLGIIQKKKGAEILPHYHKPNTSKSYTVLTTEVLMVRSGMVAISFYDQENNFVAEKIYGQNSVIAFFRGGHSFRFLKDTELVEVKQGPYVEEGDKVFITQSKGEKK